MLLAKLHPERQRLILKVFDATVFIVGIVAIAALIAEFGFYLPHSWLPILRQGVTFIVGLHPCCIKGCISYCRDCRLRKSPCCTWVSARSW